MTMTATIDALTTEQLATLTPPEGSPFRIDGTEKQSIPHPYCIGSQHVAYAADHYGGVLSAASIRGAERHGASCDICKRQRSPALSYDEHENLLALVVVLENDHPRDLNAIEGLGKWLSSIKASAEQMGIKGFVFPTERQRQAKR